MVGEVAGADAQRGRRKGGRGLVSGGHYLKVEGGLPFCLSGVVVVEKKDCGGYDIHDLN